MDEKSDLFDLRFEAAMNDDNDREFRPVPIAAGMLIGALIGFALWIATDTFVFMPAFLGAGLAFGLILGANG